jgi:hypothetical protein
VEQPKAAPQSNVETDDTETLSVEDLRARYKAERKEKENLKKVYDRHTQEVAESRRQVQAILAQQQPQQGATQAPQVQGLPEVDGAEFVTNPLEAYKKLQARVAMENHQLEQRASLEANLKAQTTKQYMDQVVPDHAEMVNDLYEVFKADNGGQAPFDLQTFNHRLYLESPGTVLNMAKRAKAEKLAASYKMEKEAIEAKYQNLLQTVSGKKPARPTVAGTSGGATSVNPLPQNFNRLSSRDQLAQVNAMLSGS